MLWYLSTCVSVEDMHSTHKCQKMVSDRLQLELEMVVSYHVGAGKPNPGSL